jgi:hypothetical protein
MWITTPLILASGARYEHAQSGAQLPRATAETFTAAREAAPLRLDEAACVLVGLHPCKADAGDDAALVEHKGRVLAKLEADVARGQITDPLTLHEAITWAKHVGLPMPLELVALSDPGAMPMTQRCARHGAHVTHAAPGGAAHYDAELDARARLVAEELRARGIKPSKKALARDLKRRFNLQLDETAIIRRIRAHR